MLSNDTLVRKARTAYGELITRIDLYPQGIHVHLVGFECATYGNDGSFGVSWRIPMHLQLLMLLPRRRLKA